MARYLHNTDHSPIRYLSKKNNLTLTDLCKVLEVSEVTIHEWIKRPFRIRLEYICTMSGLFGVSVLELVYLLSVNKPQSKKSDKWYLKDVEDRGNATLLSMQNDAE